LLLAALELEDGNLAHARELVEDLQPATFAPELRDMLSQVRRALGLDADTTRVVPR
jgi:hypothetical protein